MNGFLAILKMNPAFALSAKVLTGTDLDSLRRRLNDLTPPALTPVPATVLKA